MDDEKRDGNRFGTVRDADKRKICRLIGTHRYGKTIKRDRGDARKNVLFPSRNYIVEPNAISDATGYIYGCYCCWVLFGFTRFFFSPPFRHVADKTLSLAVNAAVSETCQPRKVADIEHRVLRMHRTRTFSACFPG